MREMREMLFNKVRDKFSSAIIDRTGYASKEKQKSDTSGFKFKTRLGRSHLYAGARQVDRSVIGVLGITGNT